MCFLAIKVFAKQRIYIENLCFKIKIPNLINKFKMCKFLEFFFCFRNLDFVCVLNIELSGSYFSYLLKARTPHSFFFFDRIQVHRISF